MGIKRKHPVSEIKTEKSTIPKGNSKIKNEEDSSNKVKKLKTNFSNKSKTSNKTEVKPIKINKTIKSEESKTDSKNGAATNTKNFKKFTKDKNQKFKKPKTFKDNNSTEEVKDWKKLKLEKKELRIKRRQQKPYYTISIEMKKLYEVLKCKSAKKNKEELSKKLYDLMKSNIQSFVMAHDTARIVQCVLKKSDPIVKKELTESLIPLSVEMCSSKYAHFCVLRILKYGDKANKNKLIETLFGSIFRLTLSNFANSIIDVIYTTHATEKQKILMKQEFYGEMYKKNKDLSVKKLSDTYKNVPELKTAFLNTVKANLEQIANKNVVDNSLVHAVFYEYIQECKDEDIEEIINAYSSKISLLLTTRDGCQVAIKLFWKASTKDRRAIVKSIKEHLIKICTHEYGHMFLIALINCMDDTKAIKKQIFDPLATKLDEIMKSQWGRKVIEWFVAPGSTDNFHPKLIEYFDEGLKYGKKPSDARRKEILEQIEEQISKEITSNTSFWMSDGHIGLVTATILKKLSSNHFSNVAENIAKLITNQNWTLNNTPKENKINLDDSKDTTDEKQNDSCLGIEDTGLHIALKKMIKNDQVRISSNENCTLSEFIVRNLTDETINSWAKINRACFILINILENCTDEIKNELKSFITKEHIELFKSEAHAGAKLFIKNLNSKK